MHSPGLSRWKPSLTWPQGTVQGPEIGPPSLDGTFHRAHFEHFWLPGRSIRDYGPLVRVHTYPSSIQTRAERVAHRVLHRGPPPARSRAATGSRGSSRALLLASCPIHTRLRDAGTSPSQPECNAYTSRARRPHRVFFSAGVAFPFPPLTHPPTPARARVRTRIATGLRRVAHPTHRL